jgi:hypothetical protein
MAIDARIPLGVQPVQTQQPNMLGQYAQIMAIKAAQQDVQGNEDLRAAYASGGDLNDPEFRRRVMAANPKLGSQLIKTNAETGKLQNEAVLKRIELSREMLTGVNTPEDYIAWHEANHKDPVLGGYLGQRGVTAEQSRAKIMADLAKPGGLEKLKRESALGAGKLQQELMQTERTRISSGPAYGQLDLAKKKDAREQAQLDLVRGILTGGVTPPTTPPVAGGGGGPAVAPVTAPMGGGPAVAPVTAPMGGGPAAAPVAGAPVNALAPQPAAAPAPVNALAPQPGMPGVPAEVAQLDSQIGQLIRVGTPQALNAVNTLVARRNILMPTQQVVQNKQGVYQILDQRTGVSRPVIGADGQPLQGKVTPLPYESTYSQKVGSAAGERDVALVRGAEDAVDKLITINDTLTQLQSSDAITGFGANVLKDVERFRAQFLADKTAGKRVADTEILNAMLGSEVFGMIQSLGIGARGLDTPAEREYLREVMTGTVTMNKEALIKLTKIRKNVTERAIDKYNEKVKKGDLNKFFETQGIAPRTIEKPVAPAAPAAASADAPSGLPPEIAELWKYMPPEDRKLWQK